MAVKDFLRRCAGPALIPSVLLVGIAVVSSLRSCRSLATARQARVRGAVLEETSALDRALLEAPPWFLPVRSRALRRLERIAEGTGPAAWYATLALTSATSGARRARWQRRALELAGPCPPGDAGPMIPVNAAPPSAAAAALASAALLGWIGTAALALLAGGRASRRAAAAAALLWLIWLAALAAA